MKQTKMNLYYICQLTTPNNRIFLFRTCNPERRVKDIFKPTHKNFPKYNYTISQVVREFPDVKVWTFKVLKETDFLGSFLFLQKEINNALATHKLLINDLDYNLNPQHYNPLVHD